MVLLLANLVCAEEGDESVKEKEEPVAATVNGAPILISDVDRGIQEAMARNPELRVRPDSAEYLEMRQSALEYLIDRELIIQEGEKLKLEPKEAEIDGKITELKQRFPSQSAYEQKLKQQGYTEKKLREFIKQALIVQNVLELKIKPTAEPVTDKDIEEFYKENKEEFVESEKVSARHILIKVSSDATDQERNDAKSKMQDILKEAKGGANFAELAKKHSQCPSASQGGDLGYFTRGQMVEPFEEAVFALEPGETSEVVETIFGYHIIFAQDKKPKRELKLEEVSKQIKDILSSEKIDAALKKCLKPVREKATISILLKDTNSSSTK